MQEHETTECQDIMTYITGECSEFERAAFERHLRTCTACREEVREMRIIWDALPYEMEELEAPPDLKAEVMQVIYSQPMKELKVQSEREARVQINPQPKRQLLFPWKYSWVAAIIVGLIIGALWNGTLSKKQTNLVVAPLNQPVEVIRSFDLRSADNANPSASGTAWLVHQGSTNNVVVNLKGLKKTHGDWTYQVWLIRKDSNKRYNCGTLNVDDKGDGVLTYYINPKFSSFDAVGVTLEADPNGDQPRGIKVLGS
jgi:anti-sigma-K factor RskA